LCGGTREDLGDIPKTPLQIKATPGAQEKGTAIVQVQKSVQHRGIGSLLLKTAFPLFKAHGHFADPLLLLELDLSADATHPVGEIGAW